MSADAYIGKVAKPTTGKHWGRIGVIVKVGYVVRFGKGTYRYTIKFPDGARGTYTSNHIHVIKFPSDTVKAQAGV